MASGSELAVQYDQAELAQWRDPERVLAEATAAAASLTRVLALKKNPVMFNGEQYLELEDWQTVGKFYGLTAKVLETRYVEYGGVTGWEAVAVAINQQGVEVSRAESMCLSDESNWGAVPVYEWQDELDANGKKIWVDGKDGKKRPKGKRVQVGSAPKPLFQLRSMAQTRACGKAFRQVLSWVVVLGGFKPNVAEEMIEEQLGPEQQGQQARTPVTLPQRASEKKAEAEKATAPADDPNVKEINGKIQDARVTNDGSLWLHIDNALIFVKHDKVQEEMAAGNMLAIKAGKLTSAKVGEYWATLEVRGCLVADPEVVDAEVVEEEKTPFDEPPVPPAAAEAVSSIKEMFDSGKLTTASKLPESTQAKKETAWKAHVGHDPAVHISYKQDALIYRIQSGRSLTDEVIKAILMEDFGVGHRYHLKKDDFPAFLNFIDPDFNFHERK